MILPTTIGGAFLVINESYAPVCSVLFVTAAAALQGGSLLVAAYYLDQELTNRKDEIDQIPFDEEVLRADEEAKVRSEALRKNTVWKRVPLAWKAVLILATALMTVERTVYTSPPRKTGAVQSLTATMDHGPDDGAMSNSVRMMYKPTQGMTADWLPR